jgi:UDP-2,3-diacylglucosamine pyrophosphatase LpxH
MAGNCGVAGFWPQAHNDIVQKILRKARKGTTVVYIPGNHDAFGRHFGQISFGGIELHEEVVHTTADGRRLLVVHGDLFDGVIQHAKWLAFVGDRLYMLALHLNRWFNAVRARFGVPYWSLSQFLKHKVKNAVSYITDFEIALAQEARRRSLDGIVCGHIHKAEIRSIGGVLYCNDGDWVESLTALVEDEHGELSILHWKEIAERSAAAVAAVAGKETAPAKAMMVATHAIRADLERRGFRNLVMWTRGVDTALFRPGPQLPTGWTQPVFMYVGRVAVEKNIEAFLSLDLPGTKVVVSDGPQRAALERRFPAAVFTGAKIGEELAAHFRSADVFVFPSRTDTFGLVLLEAMASGTPAAAFPVTGPIDVVVQGKSGVLSDDLRTAALAALTLRRDVVRQHALHFSWERATTQFLDNLHPNHAHTRLA